MWDDKRENLEACRDSLVMVSSLELHLVTEEDTPYIHPMLAVGIKSSILLAHMHPLGLLRIPAVVWHWALDETAC